MTSAAVLTIALAQINPMVGDFAGNLQLAKDGFVEAQRLHAQLLVFPELSLCGYYPGDLLNEAGFLHKAEAALAELLVYSAQFPQLTAIVGLPEQRSGPGKPLYNALLALRNGKVLARYYKQLLPTYNIFDERRHFEPGPQGAVCIEVAGYKIGLLICEDGWNDQAEDYAVNPFEALAASQPDLLVSINASPANIGKRAQRREIICAAARRHALPLVYVNQVGGQDSIVFDGASFAVQGDGSIAHESPAYAALVEVVSFAGRQFAALGSLAAGAADLESNALMRRHICLGLLDYARRCGFKRVVVGCSGGIDSAVTLALAVAALGADQVTAITMPSAFSSSGSVTDSEVLCANLGVQLYTHPIQALVADYAQQFQASFAADLQGLTLENLQARIRGTILMAYSNHSGALVLTTGNKSEISVGYCTLYGDTNGGLGLIGDLYKTEVYALAAALNREAGRELIPAAIISKPPSAELAPGQQDTDSLPPYEVLDELLKWLIEGRLLPAAEYAAARDFVAAYRVTAAGEAGFQRIAGMIARNEYKRRQAPPIIRVRPRAFGAGRQMPIAARF